MAAGETQATLESRNTLWAYVFFLGIGVIAIALRTPELSTKGFWLDEAYSSITARLPLLEMLDTLRRDATPPLYYLILAPWIRVFGSGEAAVRALSVVFSIGGISLMGLLAYRYFSLRTASVVTLLLAFTPMHIYYAQEARMYALLALLGTALAFASIEFLARRSRRASYFAASLSLLMLLTHNVAAWFVIGANIAVLALCRDWKSSRQWINAQLVAAILYLPWLSIALDHVGEQRDVLAWFTDYWSAKSAIGHFMTTIGTFALGDFPPYVAIQSPLSSAPFLRGGALLLMCFGLYRGRNNIGARFIAVTLFAALVISLGYSAFFQPVHIPGRTDQAYLPLFVLLLAIGIEGLRPRPFEAAVLLVGMVGSLAILQIYHDNSAKNDSRAYLRELQANLKSGDIVVTTGLTWAEATYYLDRWSIPATILSFPRSVSEHPGYINYKELMQDPTELYAEADDLTQLCKETLGPDNSVFLLYLSPLNVNGIIAERLVREFPHMSEVGSQTYRQSVLGHGVRIIRMQPGRRVGRGGS